MLRSSIYLSKNLFIGEGFINEYFNELGAITLTLREGQNCKAISGRGQ